MFIYLYWNHYSKSLYHEQRIRFMLFFQWVHDHDPINIRFRGYEEYINLYDHYHLKLNLEETLLSKWKKLKPYIDLLFKVSIEDKLNLIFEKTLEKCVESNHSWLILIHFMERKKRWVSYAIDRVKGTFGLRGSLISESNHSTVQIFVL